MSNIDKDYELKVLKMVVNKYLDETMSATEENLKALEINCDQVVWELATIIYSQSGNRVELCILRDLVNSWIGDIKYQLAAEKKHIAEQTLYAEFRGDDDRAKVFVKLRKIISETLCVDESQVTLNSHLSKDLGADGLDLVELVITLEEEFDIEIPDEEIESYLDFSFSSTPSSAFSPSSGSLWGLLESILPCSSQYSSSYYSGDAGANCIVENFLNLICEKIFP